jgi:hypothetical protein
MRNKASPNINQPSSDTSNDSIAEEAILEDTKKHDEELLRMVQERKRQGAKRGKIAWLMRLDIVSFFTYSILLEQFYISFIWLSSLLVSLSVISFPNSGTSFTSLLIRLASNTTSGTNYGMETNPGASAMSVPVYDWSEFGPYWIHPPGHLHPSEVTSMPIDNNTKHSTTSKGEKGGSNVRNYDIPSPTSSIITKTHCGSRCVMCPPQEYLETGVIDIDIRMFGFTTIVT